jgi:hypothetical protein
LDNINIIKDEIFYLIDNVTILGNENSAPYGTITGYASTNVAAYSIVASQKRYFLIKQFAI